MVALTFPVPVADFAALLRVRSVRWMLREFYTESGTRGGRIWRSEFADPRWEAEIALAPMARDDAREVRSLLRRIGPYNQFHLYNPEAPYPRLDPDGSEFGAANVVISDIGQRALKLTGIPNGYRLRRGDFLSVGYSGRRALYEISEDATVSGSLTTPWFEVTPPPRIGMVAGDPVDLKQPPARMQFSDFDPGLSDIIIASGITLNAIESPF